MSSWFTVLLWALLVTFFLALYRFLSGAPDGGLVLAGAGAALVAGIAFVAGQAARTNALAKQGAELYNAGRFAEALERFRAVSRRRPLSPDGVLLCGLTRLMLWRLDEALADFDQAAARVGVGVHLAGSVRAGRGLALALLGRLEEATLALAVFRGADVPALPLLALAVVALRRGDADECASLLDRPEAKELTGTLLALAAAMRAMVAARRGERSAVDRVALFGETGPERLRAAWPELLELIDRAGG